MKSKAKKVKNKLSDKKLDRADRVVSLVEKLVKLVIAVVSIFEKIMEWAK